jgi:hypothetical protein
MRFTDFRTRNALDFSLGAERVPASFAACTPDLASGACRLGFGAAADAPPYGRGCRGDGGRQPDAAAFAAVARSA